MPPIDAAHCRALNEGRQAYVVRTLADEHERIGAGVMTHTEGCTWICKAVGVDLDEPLDAERVARIAAWFRERGVPPVIELSSLAHEASLSATADAGFALVEIENVLAVEPHAPEAAMPEGITIRAVDAADASEVRRFAEIVSSGFVPPGMPAPEPMIESGVRSLAMPTSVGWLACLEDGTPVGAAGSEVMGELLALCGTTVLPEYRRRGIQAAFQARRLRLGVERGCRVAITESKPGIPTERNAARLGFRLAYSRLVLRAPLGT